MTRPLMLSGFTLVLYLVQVSVLPLLLLYRLRIDLLLIWVISYAMLTGPKEGLIFGLAVGLLLDLTIAYPLGLQTFCKGLAGYCAGNFAYTFFREQIRLPMMICSAALLLQEGFMFTYHHLLLSASVVSSEGLITELLLLCLYTLCFIWWIYRFQVRLIGWLDRTAYERSTKR